MVHLVRIFNTNVFQYCPATGMQNGDEASPSIILVGRALLMKLLITLERQGIFGSNFVYYYIMFLTLPGFLSLIKLAFYLWPHREISPRGDISF